MIKRIKKYSAMAVSILAISLVGVVFVGAQNGNQTTAGNGFKISPVRSEYTIERGGSEQLTISLENPTDSTLRADLLINNFIASDDESGEPRIILDENGPTPKNNFKSLVTAADSLVLEPKEKVNVPVAIRVPDDATPGGYYGAVRFVPSQANENARKVAFTAGVGTIVLIRVPGDLTEKLSLIQLSAAQGDESKSFLSSGDVSVLVRLKNEGDIHVRPYGKVQVKNTFGKLVAEYELNNTDPRAIILPDSTHRFVEQIPSMRWIGRYTISANLGYSQGSGELITASTAFWYLPVWSITAIILLVAAVIWFVMRLDRKLNQKKQKSSARTKKK